MRNLFGIALAALIVLGVAAVASAPTATGADANGVTSGQPTIEVMFALDTTGSMSGLIEGAKKNIWFIVNQFTKGDPAPLLRIGMVAYRDRGDAYITEITPLTENLDEVYAKLQALRADGGGDGPESVNQALNEAVTKTAWADDERVIKIIFLVGDSPPHMDYEDDVKYQETARLAAEREVIINTVQCGNQAQTTPIWQEIARLADGQFAQVDQSGGMTVIPTPFDDELAKLNTKLAENVVAFGDKGERTVAMARQATAAGYGGYAGAPAAAESAAFKARGTQIYETNDLVAQVEAGNVKLADVKQDQLPENMQKMTPAEREKYLAGKIKERKELQEKALALSKQRDEFLAKERAKDENSFDMRVIGMVRAAGKRAGIKYE
jgi:Mg-chelatase subunit ChlD